MLKDPTNFRKRFAAYKLGKKPYLAGRPVEEQWTMKDEAEYNEWRNSLPSNLKYTDDSEYDMVGAYKSGLQPEFNPDDEKWHLASRDPKTGRILKSPHHPTFLKALIEDLKLGYYPKTENGITTTSKFSGLDIQR